MGSARWTLPPPRPLRDAWPPRPARRRPWKQSPRATWPVSTWPCARPRLRSSPRAGLPNRPWYRHTIYAPGEFTGYSAVVIPGVNEAIDAKNAGLAAQQLAVLTQALDRAASALEAAR